MGDGHDHTDLDEGKMAAEAFAAQNSNRVLLPKKTFNDILIVVGVFRSSQGLAPLTHAEVNAMTGTTRVPSKYPYAPQNIMVGPDELKAIREAFSIVTYNEFETDYPYSLIPELNAQISTGRFIAQDLYEEIQSDGVRIQTFGLGGPAKCKKAKRAPKV